MTQLGQAPSAQELIDMIHEVYKLTIRGGWLISWLDYYWLIVAIMMVPKIQNLA